MPEGVQARPACPEARQAGSCHPHKGKPFRNDGLFCFPLSRKLNGFLYPVSLFLLDMLIVLKSLEFLPTSKVKITVGQCDVVVFVKDILTMIQ